MGKLLTCSVLASSSTWDNILTSQVVRRIQQNSKFKELGGVHSTCQELSMSGITTSLNKVMVQRHMAYMICVEEILFISNS